MARSFGLRAAGGAGRVSNIMPQTMFGHHSHVNMMSNIQRMAQKMGGPTLFFTPRMATCG